MALVYSVCHSNINIHGVKSATTRLMLLYRCGNCVVR